MATTIPILGRLVANDDNNMELQQWRQRYQFLANLLPTTTTTWSFNSDDSETGSADSLPTAATTWNFNSGDSDTTSWQIGHQRRRQRGASTEATGKPILGRFVTDDDDNMELQQWRQRNQFLVDSSPRRQQHVVLTVTTANAIPAG